MMRRTGGFIERYLFRKGSLGKRPPQGPGGITERHRIKKGAGPMRHTQTGSLDRQRGAW